MDAIIELDQHLRVTQMNPAAEKVFGCAAAEVAGRTFTHFLTPDSREKLARLIIDLDTRPDGQRYLWIPGGLAATADHGGSFQAEATLSRFDVEREPFYTLILRNVNERLEAEQKIRSLTVEAEYLREEISSLVGADEIIGRSEALRKVLADVKEVAVTDATVLILGETGTGKELIARAIHRASRRRARPLIKVNCAAIPATLIESEFFGHEQGAFTGATKKRDGRFALAHGGTIFLDEVGELPLDLQSKLLRVLARRRVRAGGQLADAQGRCARDGRDQPRLAERACATASFARICTTGLNVFPIQVPPLRERRDDIGVSPAAVSRRNSPSAWAASLEPLSDDCLRRLEAYRWPGNVRELQNIIERAVITSRDGKLNLDRALPESVNAMAARGC